MTRYLITGGSSLLGKSLYETAPAGADLAGTWFTNYTSGLFQMNVTEPSQVRYVFDRTRPEVVIHCAAVGSVDFAEQNFDVTRQINVQGTANVLQAAQDYRAAFVYISTNAVFQGDNPPYSEASDRQPVNRYGSIKREAEDLAMKYRFRWFVIRPFLLYGWPHPNGRQNWATIILDKLGRGQPVKLVDDAYWMPTYAPECARAIWQLIGQADGGIYHVAADDRLTLYEFGLVLARLAGYDPALLSPVSADSFTSMAPRPKDTTYDLARLHGLGLSLRGTEDCLKEMLDVRPVSMRVY